MLTLPHIKYCNKVLHNCMKYVPEQQPETHTSIGTTAANTNATRNPILKCFDSKYYF